MTNSHDFTLPVQVCKLLKMISEFVSFITCMLCFSTRKKKNKKRKKLVYKNCTLFLFFPSFRYLLTMDYVMALRKKKKKTKLLSVTSFLNFSTLKSDLFLYHLYMYP